MRRGRAVAREALATARASPVASILTMFTVAAMVFAVFVTTGRAVGAEERVLASISSMESRAIVIRADPEAGVTTDVLVRLQGTDGIEWAGAFSTAEDARNTRNPEGTRVPVRHLHSTNLDVLGLGPATSPSDVVFASSAALEQFGLPDIAGAVITSDGKVLGVGGRMWTPGFLTAFEPLAVVPHDVPAQPEPVAVLVVIASSAALVPVIAEFARTVVGSHDPSRIVVQTSTSLTAMKELVEGQLNTYSRGLVLGLLGLNGVAVALILFGLVMMRRKDFGRRRALGASRQLIVELLLTQTGALAATGVACGLAAATGSLLLSGDPLPGVELCIALGVVAWSTTVVSALVPAIVASQRDPIHELRVP